MGDLLVKLLSTGNYYRNGKLIYSSDIFAGFIGTLTGIRYEGFTLSLNQRNNRTRGIFNIIKTFFIKNEDNVPYLLRKVLNSNKTYEEALETLSKKKLDAPVYFIIGGKNHNQGAIISRTFKGIQNFTTLNNETNGWFLVQTNYDRFLPDPVKDRRRIPAENRINSIGKLKINESILFEDVLSLVPNLNNKTIETVIMCSQNGLFNSTFWKFNETSSLKKMKIID